MLRKQKDKSALMKHLVYGGGAEKRDQKGRFGMDYEYIQVSCFIQYHLTSKINS